MAGYPSSVHVKPSRVSYLLSLNLSLSVWPPCLYYSEPTHQRGSISCVHLTQMVRLQTHNADPVAVALQLPLDTVHITAKLGNQAHALCLCMCMDLHGLPRATYKLQLSTLKVTSHTSTPTWPQSHAFFPLISASLSLLLPNLTRYPHFLHKIHIICNLSFQKTTQGFPDFPITSTHTHSILKIINL